MSAVYAVAAEGWSPSDTIALVAIVVGALGVVIAQWVQWRLREADRRDQHRREAALALGPLYSLVVEADSLREAVDERWVTPAEGWEQYGALREAWRKQKPGVMALGVSYPEAAVREMATTLASNIDQALLFGSTVTAVAQGVEEGLPSEADVAALGSSGYERLAAARAQLDELAAAIRGDAR